MPNWTNNRILVKGSYEALEKMMDDAVITKNGTYHFGSWFPIPETYIKYDTTNYPDGRGLKIGKPSSWAKDSPIVTQELIDEYKKATKEQKEKYGVVGWYDWNVENYGCKWDSEFCPTYISDDVIEINVDTPWSAPRPFLLKMSNRYPELEFQLFAHYEEGGNDSCSFIAGMEEYIDDDYVKSPANDYILKKINERQDSEERVLLTKCAQKYFNDGYWKVDISNVEDQYRYFLDCLPYISQSISGKYMKLDDQNKLVVAEEFYSAG